MFDENENQNFEGVVENEETGSIFGTGYELDIGGEINLDGFGETDSEFNPFDDDESSYGAADEEISESETEVEEVVDDDEVQANEQTSSEPEVTPANETSATSENPFEAAVAKAEEKQAEAAKVGLVSKLPIFEYAGANEEIVDTSKTFEDIRNEKAADFPELDDSNRVTWKMVYGKVTKNIANPKAVTVAKQKTDIESSKEFLDSLKKTKGDVICKITPTVTAQKKGEMPAYKGTFLNLDDAKKSGKQISIVPAQGGNIYEIRSNKIGCFAAKKSSVKDFSEIKAGLSPALPPLPFTMLNQIISFFRHFLNEDGVTEALANVYWDEVDKKYYIHIPKQIVSRTAVDTEMANIDNERFVHVMDIHSHNTMPAKFSSIDDNDEKATRIYAVIGRLDRFFPEISVRISVGGEFVSIEPSLVFETYEEAFPVEWLEQVEVKKQKYKDVDFI